MQFADLLREINKSLAELDFVTARRYMEENLDVLQDVKHVLKGNARELLDYSIERKDSGQVPMSRQELTIIGAINSYATNFDLLRIKLLLKDNSKLFLREDINEYLNNDAKIILEGMGAILKK